jgi:glycine dehydrogenase subunit 1
MTYIPHTDAERRAMLEAIGVQDIAELFQDVPADVRFPTLDLPAALAELDATGELQEIASYNISVAEAPIFLGAGAYYHFVPSVVDSILRRGEFLTAYTPYQPEVSQGTLQAIFEYQSMMCALTGMDVSNASHYDGATALAEAVIMALNIGRGRRNRVILSPTIHPHYRATVRTYTQGMGLDIIEEPLTANLNELKSRLDGNTALLAVQTPNFVGQLEDLSGLAEAVHEAGALLCVVTNPISLGLLKPPGEYGADIVVGEGQPLGIPMSYGGPFLGIFTTRDKHARRMAGRLVGETMDANGQRGYVLTLSTREQHIRRERATSNICTNQGLLALAATVYLSALGKGGLRQVAELCYQKAHYAADQIDALDGYEVLRDKPFFHEFAVRCPRPVAEINHELAEQWGIIGGYDLGQEYPHLENHMLIAVTEMISRQEIDLLVEALGEEGKPWLSL